MDRLDLEDGGMTAQLALARPPADRTELYLLVQTLWGITIPSKQVCPEHSTPFDALAEAFFASAPVSVWLASRGLGGKSRTLAYLTLTEAVVLGADATVLGGSLFQSQNVQEAMREGWNAPLAPAWMIQSDITSQLVLSNGAIVRPLTASMKTVRGPHPQRLRLDEVDEMDLKIFDAAMGQPLQKKGIQSQTVASSTLQYPDGTFAEVLKRADERDWSVHRWCYKESSNDYDGWLTQEMVERKRSDVSAEMWRVEFELQEPSVGNRAFDSSAVAKMFSLRPGEMFKSAARAELERYEFEKPERAAEYVIGADWAKEQDYTVISVWRCERRPVRLVYYYRAHRRPYPVMIGEFNRLKKAYNARGIHDGTGLGNVVNDYIEGRAVNFVMVGRERDDLLSEYVAAVERGDVRAPMVFSAYTAHLYATIEDLYLHREYYTSHLPDPVSSFALAWHLMKKPQLVGAQVVPRSGEPTPIIAGLLGSTAAGEDAAAYDGPAGLKLPWRPDGEVHSPRDTQMTFFDV